MLSGASDGRRKEWEPGRDRILRSLFPANYVHYRPTAPVAR